MDEIERAYDGVDVVCPHSRIAITRERLSREAVAAQIHRSKSECVGQIGVQLATPGHGALRKAVDEQDGSPLRVARLDRVQLNAAAPVNHVVLQHVRTLRWLRTSAREGQAPPWRTLHLQSRCARANENAPVLRMDWRNRLTPTIPPKDSAALGSF